VSADVTALEATGSVDYALANGSSLYATTLGGDVGSASTLTINARPSALKRPGRVLIRGRLSPADGGEKIVVSQLLKGRWTHKLATAASNGTFVTRWPLRSDAVFVAQVLGDADHRSSGTKPLTVIGVERRPRARAAAPSRPGPEASLAMPPRGRAGFAGMAVLPRLVKGAVRITYLAGPRPLRCGLMRAPIEERFPRPSVMGVVNVTPDSFSDGGLNFRSEDAIAAARRMLEEGAAIVDVGGESTRPGSEGVSAGEELRRVVPVLEELAGQVPVSIDTAKAEVARRAIELGAELVNDVTALRGDPELAEVVASSGANLCLMHMQGEPRTMQDSPAYEDVAGEVAAFLEERLQFAVAAGIPEDQVCLDPGFGFGKTVEQNFELLGRLGEIVALGRPVLVGLSRKRSLGRILGDPDATTGPLSASLAAAVEAYERGAAIFRVHDVREHVEALRVAAAVP
jgi:dihydropteroate synthase